MKYVSRERKYTELYIIAYKKVEAQQMAYKADYGYMQLVFNIFFVFCPQWIQQPKLDVPQFLQDK